MSIALWIAAGILAVAMLGAGFAKLTKDKQVLHDSGMRFVEDFPAGAIKAIGALEVLGAIGLIVPALVDIAPVLVPWAATGLAVTMVGAIIVHLRRREIPALLPPAVLLALAVFVAWGRFGDWAF